jgi:23S rRNA-intervening sequence protein
MKDFREMKVWQKSHELTLLMYRMTESFPKTELFGLTSQIRRCALPFLQISRRAAGGLETPNYTDSCKWPADPRANLNTICCWEKTWATFLPGTILTPINN